MASAVPYVAGTRYAFVTDYLKWVKENNRLTSGGGRVRISWSGEPLDHSAWRREFRRALNRRINTKGAEEGRGNPIARGRHADWFFGNADCFVRDQRRLDDILRRRVRHYQFESRAVRERFSHLLSRYDEDDF